ncbi:hypothetical protein GDO86_006068 [Hymenochirus boettgeri]|uniref:Inositol oxygenase n=1 Tax=Hymenochirus boettgeri TaxID=247094 RepID=A0A8T2JA02_9PIPI|nr:hypothetical protein GDO86_006068 [Hymenochirus boettgeri]
MKIIQLDPSLTYRPEPENYLYRNYKYGPLVDRVKMTYTLMHKYQTLQFVKDKHVQWCTRTHRRMSVMEALSLLDNLVDESDPDVDFPNSFHAYQTAEAIRKVHPEKGWFQLVGLIHDIGKILALDNEPQWSVVGDTFPVGCKFQQSIVFSDTTFKDNADTNDPIFSTKYGIYKPNCGLENVLMSWGHDEYLYKVLTFNDCTIPEKGLYMIRFHSFYPWHTGGDYQHLCNEKDHKMLPWVKEFNKFDLYTKTEELPNIETLRPYYQSLIDKYCPGELKW